ncbi:MAG: hypothetical protein K2I25_03810 [Muribaculaceae bacterium]|nr:hypothetical protein [Muribaculaceae bacterium]
MKKVAEIFGGFKLNLYLCTRFRGTAVLNKSNDEKFDAKSKKIKKVERKFGSFKKLSLLCKEFPPQTTRRFENRTLKDLQ